MNERYYINEKVKDCFFTDAFNMDVIREKEGKLEMLSSKVIKPEEHGVILEKGIVFCKDDHYNLKEVSKEKALETLKEMELNYSCWQEYMSGSY